MFFVRMGCGSWKGKCPGTKDSPRICASASEFTKHSYTCYLCPPCSGLHQALQLLSLSLFQLQASCYLEHHIAVVSSPALPCTPAGGCLCPNPPYWFSALCLDCLPYISLGFLFLILLRLFSVLLPPPPEVFPECS